MPREPVSLARPAADPAGREHSRVLAGTVVVDRLRRAALLETDLQVVLGGGRLGEQAPDGLDLLGLSAMRGGGDRQVHLAEIVPRAHERQRLKGLGRRT